jgi:hypothetical protein
MSWFKKKGFMFKKTLVNNYKDYIIEEVDELGEMDPLITYHVMDGEGNELARCGTYVPFKQLEAPKKMIEG